jgi:cyclase
MLKARVMPTLLYKDDQLVKGVSFDSWRRVGSVMQYVKVYNLREVDELVFLDIAATGKGRPPDFSLIDEIADECFMPLTVGGGIRSVEDVRRLLQVGADKVAVNTALVEAPDLIREISGRFGAQCVVASIDARRTPKGVSAVIRSGSVDTGLDPAILAGRAEALGAGEILLGSVDRDGTMSGFDLDLVASVSRAVRIPVIASGGAGSYEHMAEAISRGGASAVAAASMFQFTEQTPLEAKQHLRAKGIAVRM